MPTLHTRKADPTIRRDPFRWLYQSYRWHKFSKQYLTANRLCKLCLNQGLTVVAKQVDHIIPLIHWQGNPYELSNLQPLCKPCHSTKTRKENKE